MKAKILTLAIILLIGITSCQKTDVISPNSSEEMILKSIDISVNDLRVEEIAQESCFEAEYFSNSEQLLKQIAHMKGRKGNLLEWKQGLRYQMGQCPDVSIDTADAGYPITITLNYGESTVLQNGRTLSGTMIIEITGPKQIDGTTRTVNYADFVIDSVTIEGTIVQKFSGDNVSERIISVNEVLSFTFPDGTEIDRTSARVHNWLEGIDTMGNDDDKIEITGSVNTTVSGGDSYLKEIVEPLIKLGNCHYFVKGITQISLNGEVISVLDFGNGECDNNATLATGGETINIDLSGRIPKANRTKKNNGNKGKGR